MEAINKTQLAVNTKADKIFQSIWYDIDFKIEFAWFLRNKISISFSDCQIRHDIRISIGRTSIFSSDMTSISYFNIIINTIIITDSTFSRVLKITSLVSHLVITSSLLKCFFITSLQYFDHTANKIVNCIFA